ncbi:Pentatricopeptide repeat-containing protein At2g13600 [Linum perenne]
MQVDGVKPNQFTLSAVLKSCSSLNELKTGKAVHGWIWRNGIAFDVVLENAVLDLYVKCGDLRYAEKLFEKMEGRDTVSWNIMIGGYLHLGEGVAPNHITFLAVLNACSHAGLSEEGSRYFNSMVDLYGRAGCLDEAKRFILENGISHLTVVWKSLLSSCRLHKNAEVGKWVCERLIELEPLDTSSYVLLSNIFSADDHWEEAAKARALMVQGAVPKLPGQSWI